MDGFLLIDKPAGWTSHDVVARLRRLLRQKRVGHTGTLDPDATGLLIVCVGQATRLIEYTAGHHKWYTAVLALGVETDSQDAAGTVTARADASSVTSRDLDAVLPRFTGEIYQVPPMVSAVHHAGERLYDIARRGETVERAPRRVTVYRLKATDFRQGEVATATLEVECSAGTYVRTLCHDIGSALGVGGHMQSLRRTGVGPFTLERAFSLEAMAAFADEGNIAERLIHPPVNLLPRDWPVLEGTPEEWTRLVRGQAIPAEGEGDRAAFITDGRLGAVLRRDGDLWKPEKVFPDG